MIDNPFFQFLSGSDKSSIRYTYIKDSSTYGVTYYGQAVYGTSTSSTGWSIIRSLTSGGLIKNEIASAGGANGYIWDNRASYFTPLTTFSNLVSTRLDGINDYIAITDSGIINAFKATNATISLWFNPENLTSSLSALFTITSTSSATPLLMQLEVNNRSIYFARRDDAGVINAIQPSAYINTRTWNHMVLVKEGDVYTLYLNRVGIVPVTQAFGAFSVNAITFGATRRTTTTEYYSGLIDEATVWNTALTTQEVTELYNNGVPVNPTTHSKQANLIAHWQFGDIGDVYPIINDRLGTNHGTMTNMSSSSFVSSPARV